MCYLITLAGVYNLLLVIFHLLFWRMFKWKTDLRKLGFANKAIIQILNIQLIYYFLVVAIICFAFPEELVKTNLGRFFLFSNAMFWLIRTLQQFVFLRVKNIFVNYLTVYFFLGVVIFSIPLIKYYFHQV